MVEETVSISKHKVNSVKCCNFKYQRIFKLRSSDIFIGSSHILCVQDFNLTYYTKESKNNRLIVGLGVDRPNHREFQETRIESFTDNSELRFIKCMAQ